MNTSTLFLNNISVVDHAYIDNKGKVIGGSFNPSFLVTGSVDPIEQVVVDFSTIKKDIKKIIDDHNDGFDHKLWIIDRYSLCDFQGQRVITVNTPSVTINAPVDAIRFITGITEYSIEAAGKAFEAHVQAELQKQYPKINITVKCINSTDVHLFTGSKFSNTGSMFTYVHGLKDSTSYGCQNNSHGHLSFIQLLAEDFDWSSQEMLNLQKIIAEDLDKTVFIRKENIKLNDATDLLIEYTTPRGFFAARYKKADFKIVILDTETTIEHLAEYVEEQFRNVLKMVNVRYIAISEGLSKGALIEVKAS